MQSFKAVHFWPSATVAPKNQRRTRLVQEVFIHMLPCSYAGLQTLI